jgi:hypothetical protein
MKRRLGKIFAGKNRAESSDCLAEFDPEFKDLQSRAQLE